MSQLSAETFVAVRHQMIQNLGGPMAVLLPLALLSALVTLALLWRDRGTAATLPGDWRSIQSRWELFHTIRTFVSIGAVVAVTISAVVVRPDESPHNQVGQGRAVAGTRSE
jgi:heme/copper-type cytochrome/quinol oxidase subunit 2